MVSTPVRPEAVAVAASLVVLRGEDIVIIEEVDEFVIKMEAACAFDGFFLVGLARSKVAIECSKF